MIISQPKTSFLGVVFDGDHDFEGPRSPKAHLDNVNSIDNLSLDGGSIIIIFEQKKKNTNRLLKPRTLP